MDLSINDLYFRSRHLTRVADSHDGMAGASSSQSVLHAEAKTVTGVRDLQFSKMQNSIRAKKVFRVR
jgi:hypothetical protein